MYKVTINLKNKTIDTDFNKKGSAERFFIDERRKYYGTGVLMVISELNKDGTWRMIKHN